MSPAVEVRLVELRGLHPGWGADRLRYRLAREGVDPLPSRAAIVEYNTDRPHQAIGRCTPAERFATRATDPGSALDLSALDQRRTGDDWISHRVASNGVISVSWQQFSVGKHHSGEQVDVHVTDRLLEVWSGNELIKTLVRTSGGESRKKRAERTTPHPVLRRQASPQAHWSTNHPSLDRPTASDLRVCCSRRALDGIVVPPWWPLSPTKPRPCAVRRPRPVLGRRASRCPG